MAALFRRLVFQLLIALLPATVALAQQAGVELRMGSRTLEPGEAVDAQLVCTNTGRPEVPVVAVPDGLELVLTNSIPSSSSFTQIINGRRTRKSTFTYQMRLTALKEGTYTLGPISVVADGQTYKTTPIRIVVRNTETMSVARGDSLIYVDLEAAPTSLYVTEQFTATLTIGIRKVEFDGRVFKIDLLRSVLDTRGSQLSIFANGRAQKSERWLSDSDGGRHRYEIFKVTKNVRAEEVGEILVGPVFLKANYPTAVRRGLWSNYEIASTRKETARADAIPMEVKAPPQEGRPDGFTGAIGTYALKVSAKPTRVEQGQPVTLTLFVSGNPLEGIAGPDLTRQPELTSRFDYTKDELVGDLEGNSKVFRRAIFPKQVGEQTIPPILWSYFDPRRERYVTLMSDPIDLRVERATATPGITPVFEQTGADPEATTLTVLRGGISPNFIDAGAVLADQSFGLTLPWIVTLVASPFIWLTVTLTTRHHRRLSADPSFARRRRARKSARTRISRALRNGDSDQQLHGLADALTGYISDRFGQQSETLTSQEVRSLLAAHDVEESLAADVATFLEACDTVRYARGGTETRPPRQAVMDVHRWINRLERGSH